MDEIFNPHTHPHIPHMRIIRIIRIFRIRMANPNPGSSDSEKTFLRDLLKTGLLKTSVIAKAYVQSTNILSYLYKTEVFPEIQDN